jgi:hypothetical protein
MAILAFGACGIAFRFASGFSISACIFAKPDCSSAIATWCLVAVTAVAFLAAFEAATKAGHALEISRQALFIETRPILGISLCAKDEHTKPNKTAFFSNGVLTANAPHDRPVDQFVPLEFDFENLGREALLNVEATIRLSVPTSTGYSVQSIPLFIGNIGPQKEAHLSLMLGWNDFPLPIIEWLSPTTVDGQPLRISPMPPQQIQSDLRESDASTSSGDSLVDFVVHQVFSSRRDRRWILTSPSAANLERLRFSQSGSNGRGFREATQG